MVQWQYSVLKVKKKVDDVIDESIGNWLKGAALGGMMAMSPMQANAQNSHIQGNDSTNTTVMQHQMQQMSVEDLIKKFPRAYKDRNANPKVWVKNQKAYVSEVNGKICLVGKIAASHGQNPWNALLKKYCQNSDENIFNLGDFDIQ
jgi:recombination DNA repair RAD52 pathway protein